MRSALAVFGFALMSAAGGADWPRFHGPDGTGVAADAKPPLKWTDKENVAWKTALPGPGSSPVVVGDRVFVTCYSGYGTSAANPGTIEKLIRHLVCLDRGTGKIKWTADVPAVTPEDAYRGYITEHGYASSTPAADADTVYCFFGKSGAVAFDFDGKKRWQTGVGTQSDVRQWGSSASPVLFRDLVIVNAASEARAVVALDKKTGKEVWRADGNKLSLSFSTPALMTAGDKTDLVVAMPGEVWGMNPETGKLRWLSAINPSGNVCPAVVPGDGVAYLTGGFQTKGSLAVKAGGSGDVSKTNLLWTARTSSYVPTPVLFKDRLHCVSEDGIAICQKTDTGAVVYEERLPVKGAGGASRPFYASPALADGKLYVPSRRSGVFVLKASDTFELLHQNPALDDSDFNASPAAVGNQLFLRSNKFAYCIEAAK